MIKEVKLPPQEDFISGALPKFIDNWKLITTDPVTLDAVTGLTIPFKYLPPCRLPTQGELSSKDVDPVVDAAVAELLVLKAAVIVADNTEGFYSRVFTVPKVERGVEYARRFIINLKVRFIIWTLVSQSHNFIQTETIKGSRVLAHFMPTLNPVGDTIGYTLFSPTFSLSNIPLFSHLTSSMSYQSVPSEVLKIHLEG